MIRNQAMGSCSAGIISLCVVTTNNKIILEEKYLSFLMTSLGQQDKIRIVLLVTDCDQKEM